MKKVSLFPLIVLTFLMVSGGTYGTEGIIQGAGYSRAILILLLTPLLWSLPTALMVGELASALPEEGGYYAWVRRGLGPFWGFQEAWLSLVASIFDMALYPTLIVIYLTSWFPSLSVGHKGLLIGLTTIGICTLLNILGVSAVAISSVLIFACLTAPFVGIVLLAPGKFLALYTPHPAIQATGLLTGIVIAMWNYMGWDSASTIATQVKNPQKTYPVAMILTILLVVGSYIFPMLAVEFTGIDAAQFTPGSYATFAGLIGGKWLELALIAGGIVSAFGMFNALVLSYCRLPLAMAQDGLLPGYFTKVNKSGAPWVSILICSGAWALCLGLGFQRLITFDVLLAGLSVLLEFAALVALRIKEPDLPRPFRVPGGLLGSVLIGVSPAVLLAVSMVGNASEKVGAVNGLAVSTGLVLLGCITWLFVRPKSMHY